MGVSICKYIIAFEKFSYCGRKINACVHFNLSCTKICAWINEKDQNLILFLSNLLIKMNARKFFRLWGSEKQKITEIKFLSRLQPAYNTVIPYGNVQNTQ